MKTTIQQQVQVNDLPANDLCVLVVWSKEVMVAVGLGGQSSVLADIEDACLYANPVHVASQLLGNVRLASSRQTDHSNDMRNVDIRCCPVT